MATITITIVESPLQLLAGIPSKVTLEANVPSTIFYTLDGTEPTIGSSIAVGPIDLPTDSSSVVLKIYATNGVDESPIVTQEYFTNVVPARHPYDEAIPREDNSGKATFPFGSPSATFNQPYTFGNTAGTIVDDNQSPRQADGYDGTATGTGAGFFTPPKDNYNFLFSQTDEIGQTGRGIGTLPARVLYVKKTNDNTVVESTDAASAFFDPKALVIFQDSRDEPYDQDVPKINRPYFDLEDGAKSRDGTLLTNIDSITPQGSFVKAHYNPTDNSLSYYYYDNRVGRWIISKEPYYPSQNPTTNLSGIVSRSSSNSGAGKVFKWMPFKYRRLV